MTDLPDVLAQLKPHVNDLDYPEAKPALLQLRAQYRQAIALPGEPLGVINKVTHHIALQPGAQPSYVPSYRLPHSQKQVVQQKVDELLKRGYYSRIPISMELTPLPCSEKKWFIPPCD